MLFYVFPHIIYLTNGMQKASSIKISVKKQCNQNSGCFITLLFFIIETVTAKDET